MQKRVLFADDENELREMVGLVFEAIGIPVVLACDGREAIEKFDPESIGCVVTDLKMPRVDGFGVLKHVKSVSPAVPVIIVSGHYSDPGEAIASAEVFLAKPFKIEELLREVGKHIPVPSVPVANC
jgi:DNA-binding NtrC family response regulator